MEAYELRSLHEALTEEIEKTAVTSPEYVTLRELRRWVADKVLMLDLLAHQQYLAKQAQKAANQ